MDETKHSDGLATVPGLRKKAVETWHKSQITNILTRTQLVKVLEANYLPDVPRHILKMPPGQRKIEIDRIIDTALQGRDHAKNDAPPADNVPPAEATEDPQMVMAAETTLLVGSEMPPGAASASASGDADLSALERAAAGLADAAHAKIAAERAAAGIKARRDALQAQITALQVEDAEAGQCLKAARMEHGTAKARLMRVVGKQMEVTA